MLTELYSHETTHAERILTALDRLMGDAEETGEATPQVPRATTVVDVSRSIGNLLGPATTGLEVTTEICLDPIPTGFYQLLDPHRDPLLRVTIKNSSHTPRRVGVTAYLDGLSAKARKTVEVKAEEVTLPLLPTLRTDRAARIGEAQRATLHVEVQIFGNPDDEGTGRIWESLVESQDSYVVTLLSRNSSCIAGFDPSTGDRKWLTQYFGAWVTPHIEPVQKLLRDAVDVHPDKHIAGYQGKPDPEATARQVQSIFAAVKQIGIRYVNSLLDFGAGPLMFTQRTRLPRESIRDSSANCIDGTVLFASLLEAASLQPALVFVPGHAFLAWQTWAGRDEWDYLETTMVGTQDFDTARAKGRELHRYWFEGDGSTSPLAGAMPAHIHTLSDLRRHGVLPME
jgi:hypothetical protein